MFSQITWLNWRSKLKNSICLLKKAVWRILYSPEQLVLYSLASLPQLNTYLLCIDTYFRNPSRQLPFFFLPSDSLLSLNIREIASIVWSGQEKFNFFNVRSWKLWLWIMGMAVVKGSQPEQWPFFLHPSG